VFLLLPSRLIAVLSELREGFAIFAVQGFSVKANREGRDGLAKNAEKTVTLSRRWFAEESTTCTCVKFLPLKRSRKIKHLHLVHEALYSNYQL
jgi:hypothetical protein